MNSESVALWVQVAAVLAAVGSSLVALRIAKKDRGEALRLNLLNQQTALRHAKMLFDLENLRSLLQIENRGGSVDQAESQRMGADALTLTGLIGPERLPELWTHRVGGLDDYLLEVAADPDFPQWKRDAIAVQLAVNAVSREIAEATSQEATST